MTVEWSIYFHTYHFHLCNFIFVFILKLIAFVTYAKKEILMEDLYFLLQITSIKISDALGQVKSPYI